MPFSLISPAFDNRADVPLRYTCSGENLSPAFAWSGAPDGTKSFALVCSDPDAPLGTFFHWAVFDIPADRHGLDEALPPQAELPGGLRQVENSFGRLGYGGPCPPKGHGLHHYHFRLYALDAARLALDEPAHCREVEAEARRHSLGMAELVGLFER
ncbi:MULTISPECIES: YbhB/YbcL family Raf kinase inhibitor-like protein [Alphaproteobacteria]|uniref:PEBP family protein n=2 Tax=Alphaproteobacteria TaxID=28211 RepID=A0A512HFV2_9HYPH|nr:MULTISPECIES: YbhB/YbcL family Raf kinase inhibitor-like protein [Alphaproteobacteria]GEO84336.1 PEBP family protein [Ciceribacter naphthalenivorans]GLR24873.1 PEBP family protein [Ciceribacter naphthalenivorans]GLT07729.1 PEBP family protein [Sphingomonas psychrolutea]